MHRSDCFTASCASSSSSSSSFSSSSSPPPTQQPEHFYNIMKNQSIYKTRRQGAGKSDSVCVHLCVCPKNCAFFCSSGPSQRFFAVPLVRFYFPHLSVSPFPTMILITTWICSFEGEGTQKIFLTLPPMGYRILWLPWGGGLRGPPLRNQGRSHF